MRRSAAKLFGLVLSVACLAYFSIEAREILSGTDISWSDSPVLRALPIAALPYLAAYGLLAISWHCLLRSFGLAPKLARSVGIYLATQIAKYLPGNVGHHVGRVYLSSANGLPGVRVGMSMIAELALVMLAAVLLSLPLAPLVIGRLSDNDGLTTALFLMLGLLASGLIAGYLLSRHRIFTRMQTDVVGGLRVVRSAGGWRFLVGAATLTVSGMILAGASLVALNIHASDPALTFQAAVTCIAVFSAAWVAGTLAPGAPAGLGVREAILLEGLSPVFGGEAAVEITIFFRVLTVGADLMAMLVGSLLLWRHQAARG